MATRTLAQLILGARQLANVVNSKFVDDTELTDRVNEAVKELYDLVIETYEHYFVSATAPFTLAGGIGGNSVAIPTLVTDFYKDNTLEKDPGTTQFRVIDRLDSWANRDRPRSLSYIVVDNTLFLFPPRECAGRYTLWYTPDPPVLTNVLDLNATLTKWYNYIQIHVAIYIHNKRGKTMEAIALAGDDANPQPRTLAAEKRRVQQMARNRSEQAEQVPMNRARIRGDGIFDWDDTN